MDFFLAIRNRILMDASWKAAIWIWNHPLFFSNRSALEFFVVIYCFFYSMFCYYMTIDIKCYIHTWMTRGRGNTAIYQSPQSNNIESCGWLINIFAPSNHLIKHAKIVNESHLLFLCDLTGLQKLIQWKSIDGFIKIMVTITIIMMWITIAMSM